MICVSISLYCTPFHRLSLVKKVILTPTKEKHGMHAVLLFCVAMPRPLPDVSYFLPPSPTYLAYWRHATSRCYVVCMSFHPTFYRMYCRVITLSIYLTLIFGQTRHRHTYKLRASGLSLNQTYLSSWWLFSAYGRTTADTWNRKKAFHQHTAPLQQNRWQKERRK